MASLLLTILIVALCFVCFSNEIRPTRQRLIDTLRLNRWLKVPRSSEYTVEELDDQLIRILIDEHWDKNRDWVRNGYILQSTAKYNKDTDSFTRYITVEDRGNRNKFAIQFGYFRDEPFTKKISFLEDSRDINEYMLYKSGATMKEFNQFLNHLPTDQEIKEIKERFLDSVLREII